MKREATNFNPDSSLDSVVANDISDNAVESRHIAKNEIDPDKSAMVERNMATPVALDFEIVADATGAGIDVLGGVAANPVPFKLEVLEVIVQARAASASGTVTVRKGTTAITDAIVAAVDKVVSRAGTIDNDESVLDAGDALNVLANGAADRALVTIIGIKRD